MPDKISSDTPISPEKVVDLTYHLGEHNQPLSICEDNHNPYSIKPEPNEISESPNNHKGFLLTPYIIHKIGLTSEDISLYSAIKMHSGEKGICTASKETLMEEAGITKYGFKKSILKLSETNALINKSLISVQIRFAESGVQRTNEICITDIWEDNEYFLEFKEFNTEKMVGVRKQTPRGSNLDPQGFENRRGRGSKIDGGGVRKQTPNKNTINKNQFNKNTHTPPNPQRGNVCVTSSEKNNSAPPAQDSALSATPKSDNFFYAAEAKKCPSSESTELAELLYKANLKINPYFKEPNIEEWADEIQDWMMERKIPQKDIRKTLLFLDWEIDNPLSKGWVELRVVKSPEGLKKRFDDIWQKMTISNFGKDKKADDKKNDDIEKIEEKKLFEIMKSNMSWAKIIKEKLDKKIPLPSDMFILLDYEIKLDENLSLRYDSHGFIDQVKNFLRKKNIWHHIEVK